MSKLNSSKIVLAVVTLGHGVNHMYQGILPLLYTPILRELGLSFTQLGMIISAHLFVLGAMQFGTSIMSRYLPKRVLLGLGNILLGLGNFTVGLSQGFLHFLTGRVVAAVGGSPQHPVGTALIAERFDVRSRGSALGVHFSFAFVGNILGPVAAGVFLIYVGWRMTLFVLIIPALVIGVLTMLLIKEPKSRTDEGPKPGVWKDVKKVLRTRQVVLLIMAQLFASGAGQGVLINYTPIILSESLGLNPEGAERIFFYVIFLVGGVVGPIVMGRLSDVFGRRVTGIIAPLSASLLLYLFITAVQPSLVLAAILLLLGVTAFAIPIVIQAILSDITSSTLREVALGIYYTLTFAFSAVWVGTVGYFADLYQTFTPIMIAAALSVMTTSIFLYLGSTSKPLSSKTYNKV